MASSGILGKSIDDEHPVLIPGTGDDWFAFTSEGVEDDSATRRVEGDVNSFGESRSSPLDITCCEVEDTRRRPDAGVADSASEGVDEVETLQGRPSGM
jgi:hypothetical protein